METGSEFPSIQYVHFQRFCSKLQWKNLRLLAGQSESGLQKACYSYCHKFIFEPNCSKECWSNEN